ncbi:HAMP domain-containing histidine kinase [Paenibacillus thalictri]|uniref:histidine kinase n=1 Tax=Paenibacillus thalictri TaxID=2527873 RepID=A0A4Q9DWW0_9BACL|nr:HAMP domain-containing histidine kinase [Paenibacillus thalictri]
MSIRLRLLFSFTGALIVTVLLFALTGYLITVAITGDVRSFSDFYKTHYKLNPLTEAEERIFLELKTLVKTDPGKLMNNELLADYDFQLRMVQAGLYLRKESKLLFISPSLHAPELGAALPNYEMGNNAIRNTFNVGNRFFSYAKYDFTFPDKERGSIFVLRERSPFAEMIRKLLPILIGVLLAVLLLTGVLLFRFITRSIIKPLNGLRHSAERIKEGDLQFEVKAQGNDEIGQLCMAFEDMRRRLTNSVQLQLQYEENRKELLSSISHDLRTPITTIKGYVEGIQDGVADTQEKMDKYLNTIHTKVVGLDRLVDELFLYSKLDLKKLPYSFETVEASRFLEDVIQDLQFDLELRGVHIAGEFPRREIQVLADREKLRRIVLNLIDNCVKYMDKPEKRIVVKLTEHADKATVEIRDNGPGIRPEQLPYIFEKFYRAESRESGKSGSGLGLAIARQLVEGHGGGIWAESEWGEGVSVFFTLKKCGGDES